MISFCCAEGAAAATLHVGVTTADDVSVYSAPASGASALIKLARGSEVAVLASNGDYYKISTRNGAAVTGYVPKQVIQLSGVTTDTSAQQPSATPAGAPMPTASQIAPAMTQTAEVTPAAASATPAPASGYAQTNWQPPEDGRRANITAQERALWDAAPARLAEYQKINKDVVAWLRIPNTNVNHPIVVYKDNNKYLKTDVYGKKSNGGTIFLDCQNLYSQKHLSAYGHNMHKSKTMMNNLVKYKEASFFAATPVICFYGYGASEWELFSAFVDSYDGKKNGNLTRAAFTSDSDFLSFCSMLQKKSKIKTDVVIRPTDQILTLVTCSYEFSNARFFVHFRRVA